MSLVLPLDKNTVFERSVKRDNSGYIITCTIIIILVIVLCIIIYAVYRNNRTSSTGQCEVGLCAINLSSGIKRCPASASSQIAYNIGLEDCTSANYCQSPKAPCAVLKDNTLNCSGVCGSGNEECNCVAKPTS